MSVSSTAHVLRLLGKSSFTVGENKINMQNYVKPRDGNKALSDICVSGPGIPEAK